MRSSFFLLTLLGTVFMVQAQHSRIVIQHAGTVQVFSDLTAAITAAPNNADLYLSGGSFVLPTGFALSKTLHFVGAGIHTDSTNATGATIMTSVDGNSFMRLASAASGSSFTGIRFNMSANTAVGLGVSTVDQTVVSVEFSRCAFQQDVYVGVADPSGSSVAFTECIFNRRLLGADGAEAQLTRCILDYQAGTGAEVSGFDGGGLVLLNCVGLGTRIGNAGGATISNCVFTRTSAPFWQSGGSTLTNNLLVSSSLVSNMSGFIESGNILAVPVGTIFVSEGDTDYQFPDDLHLQSICPGINAGTDGTDMGIYGTSSPYKDGAVPSTPHFERVDVAPATDANGNLHVAVRVAAQAD
ncbi:MAG: hypothetical protein IPO05_02730 [Flavobacteriales bacterium]|jgi:hypothetical protein|nr:hypothetical protein [Flavobacteriales bacterium]HOZ40512.1 hypothetical protein [Flavobacteriales bacterium]